MKAARGDDSRQIDWSRVKGDAAAKMCAQVVRFVRGIRGERRGGVSRQQILRWFSGTPREFVEAGITAACVSGEIGCFRKNLSDRANAAYEYVATTRTSRRYTLHLTLEVDPAKLPTVVAINDCVAEIFGAASVREAGVLDACGFNAEPE